MIFLLYNCYNKQKEEWEPIEREIKKEDTEKWLDNVIGICAINWVLLTDRLDNPFKYAQELAFTDDQAKELNNLAIEGLVKTEILKTGNFLGSAYHIYIINKDKSVIPCFVYEGKELLPVSQQDTAFLFELFHKKTGEEIRIEKSTFIDFSPTLSKSLIRPENWVHVVIISQTEEEEQERTKFAYVCK